MDVVRLLGDEGGAGDGGVRVRVGGGVVGGGGSDDLRGVAWLVGGLGCGRRARVLQVNGQGEASGGDVSVVEEGVRGERQHEERGRGEQGEDAGQVQPPGAAGGEQADRDEDQVLQACTPSCQLGTN